jgi:hypothetical protein
MDELLIFFGTVWGGDGWERYGVVSVCVLKSVVVYGM